MARARTLTREERLDMLRLFAFYTSQGETAPSKKVAETLGRNVAVVRGVWREYCDYGTVTAATPAANRTAHPTRVVHSTQNIELIQAFVRSRRATRMRTTAVDVLTYLNEMDVLSVDLTSKTATLAGVCAVQRFLKRRGYKRGKKPGSSSYHLSKSNVLARDEYVQHMHPLLTGTIRPSQDIQRKENHKGRRFGFIAGILDSPAMDFRVLILDIFRGGKSQAKEPKDYHGMFNHDYFVKWFNSFLDKLDTLGVQGANTKQRQCKRTLQEACVAYGIPLEEKEFKSALWQKLSEYIQQKVESQINQMAALKGHRVVFTPPHHSDLQPIELVWEIVKGQVGRRYTDGTGLSEVKALREEEFDDLKPSSIQGCIKASEVKLQKLYDHLVEIDAFESDEDSSAQSSSATDDSDCEHSS
ncbi:hypothetical protein DYB31_006209 [Aphanomyces astaci]|uniref:Tc1-like transposase DDE domain-containing protein n=1 Tax=Aphanomyces astaci TaxID=112090 RepID=A0A397F5D6_APHAT|nr:hypothetical protein DYB31_006209 [Aphanomyces astaci]